MKKTIFITLILLGMFFFFYNPEKYIFLKNIMTLAIQTIKHGYLISCQMTLAIFIFSLMLRRAI